MMLNTYRTRAHTRSCGADEILASKIGVAEGRHAQRFRLNSDVTAAQICSELRRTCEQKTYESYTKDSFKFVWHNINRPEYPQPTTPAASPLLTYNPKPSRTGGTKVTGASNVTTAMSCI